MARGMMGIATLACVLVAACFVLPTGTQAAVAKDKIKSLPGWNKELPSTFYSGYLGVGHGKHLHYWVAESERNPANDPVVFWFNGGPGCSSLDGFFYELGPLHIEEPIKDPKNPNLYLNPHRWNKNATVVFLEAPAGVGFSYADNKQGYITNDTQTAEDNYAALVAFFSAYPEYSKNDLFIAGESYAGAYVPMLALQVIQHNNRRGDATVINLKGILVGNGVIGAGALDDDTSHRVNAEFYRGHGLVSSTLYNTILQDCNDFQNVSAPSCEKALKQMHQAIGGVNVYDIYQPCINSGFPPLAAASLDESRNSAALRYSKRPPTHFEEKVSGLTGPKECINAAAATTYLNLPNVRQAIHVKSEAEIGKWEICSNKVDYSVTQGSLMPAYKHTIIPNIRVLIFNGDVDACVPFTHNEWWTSNLNMKTTSAWHPWTVGQQVAGYVVEYGDNFQFATVKGSGHMVPQYRPVQAEAMLSRFVNNQRL